MPASRTIQLNFIKKLFKKKRFTKNQIIIRINKAISQRKAKAKYFDDVAKTHRSHDPQLTREMNKEKEIHENRITKLEKLKEKAKNR